MSYYIVYNVSESQDGDFEDKVLEDAVKSIHEAAVANGSFPNAVSIYRLGKKHENKTRPIRVEFGTSSDVDVILRNAHKLRVTHEFKSVYLSPDGTKEQRLNRNKFVQKMKDMMSRDISKHCFIRDNKVKCLNKIIKNKNPYLHIIIIYFQMIVFRVLTYYVF